MSSIGDRLRKARLKKDLTQIEVMEITGINNKTLSGYENNISTPDPDTFKILSKLYGVSLDYLMDNIDLSQQLSGRTNRREEKDIAKTVEKLMNDLDHDDGLMFYNEPMTNEDRELLKQALELGVKIVKQKNKEAYTPKKFKRSKQADKE